ncbi:MAG: DUF2794 domain-containing protein [Pseudomonadota bacterium]
MTDDRSRDGQLRTPNSSVIELFPERPGSATVQRGTGGPAELDRVVFTRQELGIILWVYGQHVAVGEWRDYAIDMLRDRAVFSIFRRSSECPVYEVIKQPKLARKQGAYSIVAMSGHIVKRGQDLRQVMRVFDRRLATLAQEQELRG